MMAWLDINKQSLDFIDILAVVLPEESQWGIESDKVGRTALQRLPQKIDTAAA